MTREGLGAPASVERPLRLLILGNIDSVHVRRWAAFFAVRGHSVHVASLGPASEVDGSVPYPVHRLGPSRTAVLQVRRLANQLRPDVVHAHYITYYGWLARLSGVRPYAVTAWGSDILIDVPASAVRRWWARLVLKGAACVTADSEEIEKAMVRLGAPSARVHDVQFGVDTTRFAPGPRPSWLVDRLGLAGRRVVFSPRSLTPLYRSLVIVAALGELPGDVVLVSTLAGADPRYRDAMNHAARRAGLTDRVRLVPPIAHDEMDAFYRVADVVVSIPASDGTPVSILEAMSTGVPVVATNLPSVRPWLAPFSEQLLVPVDDPRSTAAAIRQALDLDGEARARIVRAGREAVLLRGDHTTNMLRMEALYRESMRQ